MGDDLEKQPPVRPRRVYCERATDADSGAVSVVLICELEPPLRNRYQLELEEARKLGVELVEKGQERGGP